jgi:hypothetical protein
MVSYFPLLYLLAVIHGTLNYNTSQLVDFDVIKGMILNGEPDVVMVHTNKKIKREEGEERGRVCRYITNHGT